MHYNNILATRNFAKGQFDEFEAVSGEVLKNSISSETEDALHVPYNAEESLR